MEEFPPPDYRGGGLLHFLYRYMTKISFRHRVEYWGFLILYTFIPHLSRRSLKRVADQVGIIWYLFASMRKRVARINLDIAFGNEKSDREKNRIILISFQNFLYVLLDGIWLSKNLSRDNWKEIIEVEGIDVINQATERGRGDYLSGLSLRELGTPGDCRRFSGYSHPKLRGTAPEQPSYQPIYNKLSKHDR